MTSLFTIAVMGVSASEARQNADAVAEMFHFVREYRPPPFPGPIDSTLAARGKLVYARQCASCHGDDADVAGRRPYVG